MPTKPFLFFRVAATLALAGFAVTTQSAPSALPIESDNRFPIQVKPQERSHVLFDMRAMLHGMFNIHNAMSRNDWQAVAKEAVPLGELMMKMPTDMMNRLPDGFMQMGSGMQESFNNLAKAAQSGDQRTAQTYMADALAFCSGCHDTYRFQEGRETMGVHK
jgi:hypothetical protein